MSRGVRERARWRGYRRPLPHRSVTSTHPSGSLQLDEQYGPASSWPRTSPGQIPTRIQEEVGHESWHPEVGGRFAADEHRGVCEWPPKGSSGLDRAVADLKRDPARLGAGILDLDGLTTTGAAGLIAGVLVESPAGRVELSRRRAAWTREFGHARSESILSDRDLAAYHAGIDARRLCSTHAAVLERVARVDGQAYERVAVPMLCGQRMCDVCFARSREVAGEALKGHWKQFLTLTTAHEKGRMLHCWRKFSQWASKMMAAMVRVAKRGAKPCRCGKKIGKGKHQTCRVEADWLSYGWVIEPHSSMWPHLHVCLDSTFFCYHWIRKRWAKITHEEAYVMKMKKVKDINGICRYLVKYLTKASFPDMLLAVLYRKRLWGRSNRPRSVDVGGWSLLDVVQIPVENGKRVLELVTLGQGKSLSKLNQREWCLDGALNGRWAIWTASNEAMSRVLEAEEWQKRFRNDPGGGGGGVPNSKKQCEEMGIRSRVEVVWSGANGTGMEYVGRKRFDPIEMDSKGAMRLRRVRSDPGFPWDVPDVAPTMAAM